MTFFFFYLVNNIFFEFSSMLDFVINMMQVPQFVLDYMWGKGEACKIVCTQPRRISATSGAYDLSVFKVLRSFLNSFSSLFYPSL